jgi:hypothetical protein
MLAAINRHSDHSKKYHTKEKSNEDLLQYIPIDLLHGPLAPKGGILVLLIKFSFQSESPLCFNYAKEMNIDERFCEE